MNEHRERRKELRKKILVYTSVYDLQKRNLLGYIRDLTLQGMQVVGERKLDANAQTILAFELPGGLPGISATHLSISARVSHCEKEEKSQTYKTGFEFIDIKPEQVHILQALLQRYYLLRKN